MTLYNETGCKEIYNYALENNVDVIFNQYLTHIMENGTDKQDRTGTGTRSVFGYQMRFDLSKGFPILSGKRVPLRLIVSELLWFLKGDTNIKYLLQNNNSIWNEWAFKKWVESEEFKKEFAEENYADFGLRVQEDEEFKKMYEIRMKDFETRILTDDEFAEKFGDLGNVYGKQWRNFEGKEDTVDQILDVINQIKNNPDSRRMLVVAWNPTEILKMALPPCHTLFQFYVADGKLSCQLYQRSADAFIGVPFNIASYAILTHMIAKECGLEVGEFIHTSGDAHIYSNHFEQVEEILGRSIKSMPKLVMNDKESIFDYEVDDFKLEGYNPHSHIKAEIAV